MKHIYIVAAFIFSFLIIFRLTEKPSGINDAIKNENKALEILSDSLINLNKDLSKKIIAYEEKVDSFQSTVKRRDKKIGELKKIENEKLHHIDSLGSNELINLFAKF